MTIEEAIDILRVNIGLDRQGIEYCHDELGIEALDMAIKALEQEPSGDLISRQAVLDGLKGCICKEWIKTLFATMVKQLPSVNPKEPKTGHWINKYHEVFKYYCDKCGTGSDLRTQYCPNCGAKMENEDKE